MSLMVALDLMLETRCKMIDLEKALHLAMRKFVVDGDVDTMIIVVNKHTNDVNGLIHELKSKVAKEDYKILKTMFPDMFPRGFKRGFPANI